mgnify:CR=1 FL=1
MNDLHRVYLNLGSNIEPESNLPKAIQMLRKRGEVITVSRAWESKAVGVDGPNFLNACVLFLVDLQPVELKEQIIRPIEAELGRIRHANKNAPRTIDIDIVLFDETPLNMEYWNYAFVAAPLAELIPDFIHPVTREKLSRFSGQIQGRVWIVPRERVVL